jgi:hypothetical protein
VHENDPGSACLGQALAQPLDWPALLKLANHHQVIPQLYTRLASAPFAPGLPPQPLQQLKSQYWSIALRNQRLAETLLETTHQLAQAGIPSIPFKGPVLAVQAYGDLRQRQFLDLDLLVAESDSLPALHLLTQAGWQPEHPLDPRTASWMVRSAYHLRLRRASPARPADVLEIHWTIADRSHVHPLKAADLWADLSRFELLSQELPRLSLLNTLLAACLHGASNQWQNLKWIVDIARLLASSDSLDWERLLHRARQLGYLRLLLTGLHLAQCACCAPLPEVVARQVQADRGVTALGQLVLESTLPAIRSHGPLENNRFFLRSRERLRDRLYYLFDQAFIPKSADWEAVSLPASLYPAYYLIRPLRLVRKFARLKP